MKIYFHFWTNCMRNTYTCIAYDYFVSYVYVSYKNKVTGKTYIRPSICVRLKESDNTN